MINNVEHRSTVALITSQRAKEHVLAYTGLMSTSKDLNLEIILVENNEPFINPWNSCNQTQICAKLKSAFNQDVPCEKIGLIVSEWFTHSLIIDEILHLAHKLRVPAIFIRRPEIKPGGRVVVATSGGPNVLQQIWVARETSKSLKLPVHLIRIMHPAQKSPLPKNNPPKDIMDTYSRSMLHLDASIEIKKAVNTADAVAESLRKDDILIMGAPSTLRLASAFEGSLPHKLADRLENPMILLSTPPNNHVSLRKLFWGGLITVGLRPHNKRSAISTLIEKLAVHNHLPHSSADHILGLAMQREAVMSTAADCDTAFPHIKLPGFFGLVGSLAICPEGVDFGSPDGKLSHFLFLLISPEGLCDEYLATLARIARRMVLPEVRDALLKCKTPAQVMDILEPLQADGTNSEDPPTDENGYETLNNQVTDPEKHNRLILTKP